MVSDTVLVLRMYELIYPHKNTVSLLSPLQMRNLRHEDIKQPVQAHSL